MAQGAAEAVKSTLGMNNNADAADAANTINPPNNPSYPANNPASRVWTSLTPKPYYWYISRLMFLL